METSRPKERYHRSSQGHLLGETLMPWARYRFRSAQRDLNAKRKVSFSLAYIADCFVSWFRQGVWREAGLADVLARTAEPGLLQSNLRQDNRSACVIEYMLYTVQLALFHVKLFSFWNIWIFSQIFSFLHGNRQIYARRFIQYIDLYCYYSEKKLTFSIYLVVNCIISCRQSPFLSLSFPATCFPFMLAFPVFLFTLSFSFFYIRLFLSLSFPF